MDLLLFALGLLLFFGSFIYLIISLIKRSFKGKQFSLLIVAGIVLIIVGVSMPSSDSSTEHASQTIEKEEPAKEPELTMKEKNIEKVEEDKEVQQIEQLTEEQPIVEDKTPELSISQRNAIRKAEDYLGFTAFSKTGLIKQLEYEGYSNEDASFAIENIEVDWSEQAVKKAESYLDFTAFSRQGLIDQLLYEGFTNEQATYAVGKIGY